MNKKLKVVLTRRRSSEQGFALPIALGLGFVMLLIAATMIMRSQGDQVTASAQKATSRGLSAAETGITRYQSLINSNRVIAMYRDCVGTRNASGVCPDTGTTISWSNATTIPGIISCSGGGGATPVIKNASTTWQDVDPPITATGYAGDPSKGQYRLVSYIYPAPGTTGTVGTAPGIGQLKVEGRVNGGSTATAGAGTATTQLQVNIPVQQGNSRTIPVPGLWFNTGNLGPNVGNGNTINGNLLYTGGCNPDSVGGTVNGTRTPAPGLKFPDLPTPPASFSASNTLGNITSALTLPRNTDSYVEKIINGYKVRVYEYKVTSINLQNKGDTITITPGKRVTFYLEGNISTGGQGEFRHSCSGYVSPGPLTPYSTTSTASTTPDFPIPATYSANAWNEGCKPTNVQVFGYGKNNLTGTSISNPQICLNGNGFLEAFILGPTYKAGVAGAGASGGFTGSIWVNEWSNGGSCGSNTSHVVVDQTTTWDELIPLGLTINNLPPTTAPVSSWQRQEAQ